VADVEKCYDLGATVVHLHAYKNGHPTWKKSVYHKIIEEIRSRCDIIICVSTSGRKWDELSKRAEVLHLKGRHKPEMASVTMGSFNFPRQPSINHPNLITGLLTVMQRFDIKPEFEIFESGMVNYTNYLLRKKVACSEKPYFNFILGSLGTMSATKADINHLCSGLPDNAIWGATGVGRYQDSTTKLAVDLKGNVRIGLEDNIWYDDRRKIQATNDLLVGRLRNYAVWKGRKIATPTEARNMLGV